MRRFLGLGLPVALAASLGGVALGASAALSATAAAQRLYVAPSSSSSADTSCSSAAYHSISAGVAAASAGATVIVCPGTYHEGVQLAKAITVAGVGRPVVDAAGLDNGLKIVVSGADVFGLNVTGAIGEGILAAGVSNVVIAGNYVYGNDLGKGFQYSECAPVGQIPGDCGEGIHLLSVTNSKVLGNSVHGNSGGILLTDETGTTRGNLIMDNIVFQNVFDCGITLASHNPNAVGASGARQGTQAGVWGNTISHNVVIGNGMKGEGAGVLLAAGVEGGGTYDNVVYGNTIEGNGLSGVTIHTHYPHQDVNGNEVSGNSIGANDLNGDPGTNDKVTTGVLAVAGPGASPIRVIVDGNTIVNDVDGIFVSPGTQLTWTGDLFYAVRTAVATG